MDLIIAARGATLETLQLALAGSPHQITVVTSTSELLRACLRGHGGLVMVDLALGPLEGAELVSLLREVDESLLLVPIAGPGHADVEFAVRAMGVFYYMIEPVDNEELRAVLESAARLQSPLTRPLLQE
jgi:FixJ family two-component response regulator